MVICSAWRIEHHCAQTVMFQPTWEASMHHHTNGFWILASKSLFTLQLTTTTTTQASIAEIQAYQCQKLISISLPTMRSGQQWQWKLKLDPEKLGDRLDPNPNYFCVYVFGAAFFPFFFFLFGRNSWLCKLWTFMHCLQSHKLHFSATFLLKLGPKALFTHLKIISLQYF